MDSELIRMIIQKLCVDIWGAKAVKTADWDIQAIADAIYQGCLRFGVDPRLALAQGILECHFGLNPAAARSRKTRNIYNVGNVDDGGNRYFESYQAGIEAYCKLMAKEYNRGGNLVTPEMMIKHDFIRPKGGRYATAPSYTSDIAGIVKRIDKLIKERGFPSARE